MRSFRTPRCKLWASGVALAAAADEGRPPSGKLLSQLSAPGFRSLQPLVLDDAPPLLNRNTS